MVRVNILLSVLLEFYSTIHHFRLALCPMLAYLSRFIPSSRRCAIGSSLTQGIGPTTLLSRFPFFSIMSTLTALSTIDSGIVPVHLIESLDWHLSKIIPKSDYLYLIFLCSATPKFVLEFNFEVDRMNYRAFLITFGSFLDLPWSEMLRSSSWPLRSKTPGRT